MGCNTCGKGPKYVGASGKQVVMQSRNVLTSSVKVRIKDWSEEPRALISKRGVNYGKRRDGDIILIWEKDYLDAPQYYEKLSEAQ